MPKRNIKYKIVEYVELAAHKLGWHSDLFGNHITTGSLVRRSNQVCWICDRSFTCSPPSADGEKEE